MAAAALSKDPPDPPGNGENNEWLALASDVNALNQDLRELYGQLEWDVDANPAVLLQIADKLKEAIQLVESALQKYQPPARQARRNAARADPAAAFRALKPRGREVHARVNALSKFAQHRTASEDQLARGPTGELTREENEFQAVRMDVMELIEGFLDDWEAFVNGLTDA